MLEVRIEKVSDEAIESHIALASTTYNSDTAGDSGHFRWKHGLSPDGPSASVNLYADADRLVGRSMIQRRAFRVDPATVRQAGLVVDLMLEPNFRSAVNFMALVRGQGKVPDLDLLVHTSNETSDVLYRRLLKYSVAFDMKAFALPIRATRLAGKVFKRRLPASLDILTSPWRLGLRSAAAVSRFATRLRLEEGVPRELEFDAMMLKFRAAAGPHFERSVAFLKWRFQTGPVFNGNVVTVRVSDRAIGYLVWRKLSLEGIEFFVLMDIALAEPITPAFRWALWLALARMACREGADMVFTMVNPANPVLADLVGAPLLPVPDSRLPHPTPIFVLPRQEELAWLRSHESTYMTLADIDYF